jgi:hypothetical protein
MQKDTTTTTIRITNETLRVLDDWADTFEISRADVVRGVLGYFTTLTDDSTGFDGGAYKRLSERMQVISESQ